MWQLADIFSHHEEIKNIAEALAIFGAFLLFLFWVIMGSLFPPLKIALDIKRTSLPDEQMRDFVNVMIALENPGLGSIALDLVEIQLTKIPDSTNATTTKETKRPCLKRCVFDKRLKQLKWGNKSSLYDTINLAKGDSTQVGDFFVVSSQDICIIETIVVGSIPLLRFFRFFRGIMQWRASGAVSPIKTT